MPRRLLHHLPAALAVTLMLLTLGSLQVLRVTDGVLAETHPAGCPAGGIGDLSGRPWNRTSPIELAAVVEGWHAHDLQRVDPTIVQRVAPCAARKTLDADGIPVSGRQAGAREIYGDALRWRTLVAAPLLASCLVSFGWLARRRVPLAVTAPLAAVGTVALLVENWAMSEQLGRAWTSAKVLGAVDATSLDTNVLNAAGTVRWISFGAVVALCAAAGFRAAASGLARAMSASRGVGLHLAVAVVFAVAMALPQSSDAVRRWGTGQLAVTIATVLVLGAAVTFAGLGVDHAGRSPAPAPPAGGWRRRAVALAPLSLLAVGCFAAAASTGRHGLYIPGILLAATFLLSIPLDIDAVTHASRPAPSHSDQQWMLATFGALCLVALGLVMIEVGVSDIAVLRTPPAHDRVLLALGLALVGLGGVIAAALRLAADRLHCWIGDGPGRAVAAVAPLIVAVAVPSAVLADPGRVTTVGAAFGSIAIFALFLLDITLLIALARFVGAWLVARPATAQWALPPLLRGLGLGRPPLMGFIVVWAVLTTTIGPGTYHDVRTIAAPGSVVQATPSVGADSVVDEWVGRQQIAAGAPSPAVFVAASGGGLRAAYWTAAVLDCLVEGETVGTDPCAGRTDAATAARRRSALLLLSGVSGGSLGLVGYVAAADGGWQGGAKILAPRWYDNRLSADFQAPVLARMLFGDLPELFLRSGSGADRAVALERAWEEQWPGGELERGFLAGQRTGEPALLLSGLVADDGCRLNVSALAANGARRAGDCSLLTDPAGTQLHATTDLADLLCADTDVRRSTAALLSARFPYISPSGRLVSGSCHGATTATHVIDGGYRESAAASPVVELLPAVEAALADHPALVDAGACAVPLFLQLDSGEEPGDQNAAGARSPNEATLPVIAINRARNGVEAAARSAAFGAFTGPVVSGDRTGDVTEVDPRSPAGPTPTRWFRIAPVSRPGADAPLGWSLSDASRAELQDQLVTNRATIELVRSLLDGRSMRCDRPATSPDPIDATGTNPAPNPTLRGG